MVLHNWVEEEIAQFTCLLAEYNGILINSQRSNRCEIKETLYNCDDRRLKAIAKINCGSCWWWWWRLCGSEWWMWEYCISNKWNYFLIYLNLCFGYNFPIVVAVVSFWHVVTGKAQVSLTASKRTAFHLGQVVSPGVVCTGWLAWLGETPIGTEPLFTTLSSPVRFLLWQVKTAITSPVTEYGTYFISFQTVLKLFWCWHLMMDLLVKFNLKSDTSHK